MEVLFGAAQFQFVVGDAAEAVGDGGDAGGELAAIADYDGVASELVAILLDERFEVLAADFFFAFDEELYLNWEFVSRLDPGFDAFHVREHLAFVVGRAAGVNVAIAHGRFERGANPFVERLWGLDVVVAVAKDDGHAGDCWRLGVNERVALGRNDLGFEAHVCELGRDPLGGAVRLGVFIGLRANAGNAEKLGQIGRECIAVALDVGLDTVHRSAASCWFQWAYNIMR